MSAFFKKVIFLLVFTLSFLQIVSQNSAQDYIDIINTTQDENIKFNALDSLIFVLKWDEDPKLYADYTDVYIDLAIKKTKYKDAIDAATFAVAAINNQLGNPNRVLEMLNSLEVYTDSVDNKRTVGSLYLKKGSAYFNGKDYNKAIENFTKSIGIFTDKDSIYTADATFFAGQAYFSKGNYIKAIDHFNLAYQYYKNLDDKQYMFYAKANIISTYGVNGFHNKTIEERNKVIAEKLSINYYDGLAIDYYNQSINYGKTGRLELQEKALLNALKYIELHNKDFNYEGSYIVINSALAGFYMDNDNMVLAKNYLEDAKLMANGLKEVTQHKLLFNLNESKYLYINGQLDAAEKIAKASLKQVNSWGGTSLIMGFNDILSKINEKKKNYNKALEYFKAKTKVEDSIFNKEKTNAFSYYQTLYETERKENEISEKEANIRILEKEKAIETGKTRTLLIVLGAIICFVLIAFYVFRQRAKQLKEKLKFHKSELISYTQALVSKSREHDVLEKELLALKTEQISENRLDKLQDLVSTKILTSEDWKQFKHKFEKVYPNFLVKARLNNNLTNAEERLLTLEKLNLKTSEIADVLGVSSESVIKNRYRLRKKLGISKKTPITEIVEN
ncbi:MAG: hypothetical protein ED556_03860 [Winogradskyella sp.]|uniref:tetratricopeptide repeat protein n=1 Tax=Winogradskyella sp. TaxID=1883156 RepID=UPI000F3DB9F6|nr:tetratricopeptide repeat protein [Winogradskyella sp.]RNC88330.1 MAG: hypothetical protein ED556_03860 [Winogradskyella sp.]